ncbi:MAG: hypothetical protein QNJ46_11260 [Leptolyngbyaceae cyanobacterium MO_188.B28]|nr:hypothetical protein [Leptolyngbyaceae cyanobacterium MO_188.B28]
MPITQESIKGWPIPEQPASIARCGMTRAKFAKRLVSDEWYELSGQGRNIGAPTEFDFYMEVEGKGPVATSDNEEKELASL